MNLFLTSSPGGLIWEDGVEKQGFLDGSNGFVEELRALWQERMRGLFIASAPDNYSGNDFSAKAFTAAFNMSGLPVEGFDVYDYRRDEMSAEDLSKYDVIILSGGHVPTQNRFFKKIHLSESIEDFGGIVIGISAGTMNCASLVYAMPELEGESLDKNYQRFIVGLGLSDYNIIPHYDYLKDVTLDGQKMIDDIACADSEGREFIALTDGSYIFIKDNEKGTLYGEAYRISNGFVRPLCEAGQHIELAGN